MKPVIVGGLHIPVVLADEDDDPELETRHAYWDPIEGRIVVDERATQEIRWHYFTHELCHAGNTFLGVEQQLRRFGLTSKQAVAIEEYMAEVFATHIDTLSRNGWLRAPPIR